MKASFILSLCLAARAAHFSADNIYAIAVCPDHYSFAGEAAPFVLDRRSQRFSPNGTLQCSNPTSLVSFGLLGTIKFSQQDSGHEHDYLVSVAERVLVGSVRDHRMWQVKRVELLPIRDKLEVDWQRVSQLGQISQILSSGFYYSDYDLTRSMQEQELGLWRRKDYFLANRLMREQAGADEFTQSILLKAIRGFVSVEQVGIQVVLISRSTNEWIGTRYNARGVNGDGHAANCFESEMIICTKTQTFAFTQIRGSVPLTWTQRRVKREVTPPIVIDTDSSPETFRKHFDILDDLYGSNHIISLNLLSNFGQEGELGRYYGTLCQANSKEIISLDLNETIHTDPQSWKKAFTLAVCDDRCRSMGVFEMNMELIVSVQAGTFRTNCLDCMDRTNIAQYMIASNIFHTLIFPRLDLLDSSIVSEAVHKAWTGNANAVSLEYSGSNAIKSELIKQNHYTWFGQFNDSCRSLYRVAQSFLWDWKKQDAIYLVFGAAGAEMSESFVEDESGNDKDD